MRNAIKYYYNLDVDELKYNDHEYLFDNYILKEVDKNVDLSLYNFFISNNLYIHKIIYNIFNNIITKIDNKGYILLEKSNDIRIDMNHISRFLIDINPEKKRDWAKLWEMKVDYYEKNIITTVNKDILEVFPYYIGLSELAIRVYKENSAETTYSICHNRLNNSNDFYSPDNIITDYKVRDIAEYIKISFFNETLDFNEFISGIERMNLKEGDYVLLYARLLFPTYFFDCVETEQNIEFFSSKINQYELLLTQMYYYLSPKAPVPKIDWLIKAV